ncbi:MAG: cytochrome oxidase subunit III [Kamptonema sp. SIO4C4]|nr:cytochrome oxidase subunit III [Kamptonema sp. SIO4C4]
MSKNLQRLGWGLFIVSALFYIAASLRSGDSLGLMGGVFFLVACLVFLVPLSRN